MQRRWVGVLVADVTIPIVANVYVWLADIKDIVASGTFTLLFMILSFVVYLVLRGEQTLPETPAPEIRPLVDTANKVLKSEKSNELFHGLVTSKLDKTSNEISIEGIKCRGREIDEKGIGIVRNLRNGGFTTYVKTLQAYWETTTDYYEAIREASKNGKKITRVFIWDKNDLANDSLLEHMSRDMAAGITTYIVLRDEIPVSERDILKDFGIWDDRILCVVNTETSSGITVDCEFTANQDRINEAKHWRDRLLSPGLAHKPEELIGNFISSNAQGDVALHEMQELLQTAPLMESWSSQCVSTDLWGESCKWYHSAWQYLRVLGMVSTPDWHNGFYRDAISDIMSQQRDLKILISGLADYGMLEHVNRAIRAVGSSPEITVLDLCKTPLDACMWYAKDNGLTIKTLPKSLLSKEMIDKEKESYDLIITDAFLTRFESDRKPKVIKAWKQLLKPGGKIITTVRMEYEQPDGQNLAKAREKFVRRAKARAYFVDKDLVSKVERLAKGYADNIVSFSIGGEYELTKLFSEGGFDFEFYQRAWTQGEFDRTLYVRLIAVLRSS